MTQGDPAVSVRTDAAPAVPTPAGERRRVSATRIVLLAGLVVCIAGTALLLRARQRSAAASAAAVASAAQNRVTPVLTAKVTKRDVPIWLEGLGNVTAFYTVTVKTQVDGRIDKVIFTEGQRVRKGDLLVQIDPRPYAIQLESAQAALARDTANLKNARVNLDRYKILTQQNLIAVQQLTDQQSSVDQLDAQVRADQSQIDSARLNLDYAQIKSPIEGVTGVRLVDPGNVVHASDSTGLCVVTQLDPIAVFFTLPEDDLAAVQRVMEDASSTPDGALVVAMNRDGDQTLGEGRLAVIDNAINQATATVRLKAIFPNPKRLLWPNQFVKARLRVAVRSGVLVVPTAAIQHGPQGTFVYVVAADSTAAVRPVTVDATQGDLAIVPKDLSPGEEVVVDGQTQLRPGARVAAKAAPGPGAPAGPPAGGGAGGARSTASEAAPGTSARGTTDTKGNRP
jgi:membrane fusion protein, multidrug efflux system